MVVKNLCKDEITIDHNSSFVPSIIFIDSNNAFKEEDGKYEKIILILFNLILSSNILAYVNVVKI